MGLDVYVDTLTRYYMKNWKIVTQFSSLFLTVYTFLFQ